MAKVRNAVEKLLKIWTAWVGRANVTDDRQRACQFTKPMSIADACLHTSAAGAGDWQQ